MCIDTDLLLQREAEERYPRNCCICLVRLRWPLLCGFNFGTQTCLSHSATLNFKKIFLKVNSYIELTKKEV